MCQVCTYSAHNIRIRGDSRRIVSEEDSGLGLRLAARKLVELGSREATLVAVWPIQAPWHQQPQDSQEPSSGDEIGAKK